MFSILVANYNKGTSIRKCLDSLINQSYENFEVIFLDDCSTDNSIAIAEEYAKRDNRIKIYVNSKNFGIGYCREKLLHLSNHDYIIFVDSDDYVETKMLKILKKIVDQGYDLIRFQNVVEAVTLKQKIIEQGEKKYRFCCEQKGVTNKNSVIVDWCTNEYCANALLWSYCMNKNLFLKNNIKFPKISFHEDFAVMPLIIAFSKKMYIIDKVFYHYLQYDDSITKEKNKKMNKENTLYFYKNKYSNYKKATNNIMSKIDDSDLEELVILKVKEQLILRLKKRYYKYLNIINEGRDANDKISDF